MIQKFYVRMPKCGGSKLGLQNFYEKEKMKLERSGMPIYVPRKGYAVRTTIADT
jgi:hypothetical protein